MSAMRALILVLVVLALGCGSDRPPPIPRIDAGYRDGGRPDAHVVRRDAGPPGPDLDGVLDDADWDDGVTSEASVETDRPGSTLTRLSALIDDDRLFVGVEGTIATGDSIVVYVDRDLGGEDGIAPSALADADGALDAAITQPSLDAAGFAIDFAWGTTIMPHTAVGLDDQAGWRDVASDPALYAMIAGEEAPTVCSATACETAIELDALGGAAPRTIALFARIVRAGGGFTNQTLPEDDAARPQVARAFLTIDDGMVVPDAGMPDAGVDAGPGGIVIDGVIDEPEWAIATVHASDVAGAGSFAGNRLRTLRALRDATSIYVAIEGTITAGNAIVMYVDHDLFGTDGLVSPTPLTDVGGALDRALSKELFTPSELRMDFAWGTLAMSRVATATDDQMGWRDVGTNPAAFRSIDGGIAPSACSATACEASIDTTTLEVPAGADVALFVRLVAASSLAVSNQTLPMDDPAAPETISMYAVLPAP